MKYFMLSAMVSSVYGNIEQIADQNQWMDKLIKLSKNYSDGSANPDYQNLIRHLVNNNRLSNTATITDMNLMIPSMYTFFPGRVPDCLPFASQNDREQQICSYEAAKNYCSDKQAELFLPDDVVFNYLQSVCDVDGVFNTGAEIPEWFGYYKASGFASRASMTWEITGVNHSEFWLNMKKGQHSTSNNLGDDTWGTSANNHYFGLFTSDLRTTNLLSMFTDETREANQKLRLDQKNSDGIYPYSRQSLINSSNKNPANDPNIAYIKNHFDTTSEVQDCMAIRCATNSGSATLQVPCNQNKKEPMCSKILDINYLLQCPVAAVHCGNNVLQYRAPDAESMTLIELIEKYVRNSDNPEGLDQTVNNVDNIFHFMRYNTLRTHP